MESREPKTNCPSNTELLLPRTRPVCKHRQSVDIKVWCSQKQILGNWCGHQNSIWKSKFHVDIKRIWTSKFHPWPPSLARDVDIQNSPLAALPIISIPAPLQGTHFFLNCFSETIFPRMRKPHLKCHELLKTRVLNIVTVQNHTFQALSDFTGRIRLIYVDCVSILIQKIMITYRYSLIVLCLYYL